VEALLERGAVARPRGRARVRPDRVAGDKGYTGRKIRRYLRRRGIGTVIPRLRPDRVAGDKGYSSGALRRYLRGRGIGAVIPRRSTEPLQATFDRDAYRERNRVERLFARLKQHRAIATRYDKLGSHYAACLLLASILLWL